MHIWLFSGFAIGQKFDEAGSRNWTPLTNRVRADIAKKKKKMLSDSQFQSFCTYYTQLNVDVIRFFDIKNALHHEYAVCNSAQKLPGSLLDHNFYGKKLSLSLLIIFSPSKYE